MIQDSISNSRCYYCGIHCPETGVGTGKGQVDHIIPVSRGGSEEPDNLVWACQYCNNSKNNKTIEEWRTAITINKYHDGPRFTRKQAEWLMEKHGLDIYNFNEKHLFWFETCC